MMMLALHTSRQFDTELETVCSRVLQMGGLVERQVRMAMSALITGDVALMATVVGNDLDVNALEMEIDEACNCIIARRQPAASDLRVLLTVIKIVTDLERIGDGAKKIARMGIVLSERMPLHFPRYDELEYAASMVLDMIRNALNAFVRQDLEVAVDVVKQDALVDEEFHSVMRYLITFMMEDPRTIATALEILFVAKAIERMGDHAKNMAEYMIYLVNGRDMRHATAAQMEREISRSARR